MKCKSCESYTAWILLCLLQYVFTEELISDPIDGYIASNQKECNQPRTEYNEEINNEGNHTQPNIDKLEKAFITDINSNFQDGINDGNQYKQIKDSEETQHIEDKLNIINVTKIYLAGYDDQIYELMNDIKKHGQGHELLVYFYLYSNLRYLNLGYYYTDKEILHENIMKYTHYFCVDNNVTKSTWCLNNLSLPNPIDSKLQIIQDINNKPTLNVYMLPSDTTLTNDKVELRIPKLHTEEHTQGLYECMLPKESCISIKDICIDLLKSEGSPSFKNQIADVNNLERDTKQKVEYLNNHFTIAQSQQVKYQQSPWYLKNIADGSVISLTYPNKGENYLVSQLTIPYREEDIFSINNDTMYDLYAHGSKKYPERHEDNIYFYTKKPEMLSLKNQYIKPVILNGTQTLFSKVYSKSISNAQDSEIVVIPRVEGKDNEDTKSIDLKNDSYSTTNFSNQDINLFNDEIGVPLILDRTCDFSVQNKNMSEYIDINGVQLSENKNMNEQKVIIETCPSIKSIENSLQNNKKISMEVNKDDRNDFNNINILQDISTTPAARNAYLSKNEVESTDFICKATIPLNQAEIVEEINKNSNSIPGSMKDVKSRFPINKINLRSEYFNFPNPEHVATTYVQNYDTYTRSQSNINYKNQIPITQKIKSLRNHKIHQQYPLKYDQTRNSIVKRYWPYRFLEARNLNRYADFLPNKYYVPNRNERYCIPKLCNYPLKLIKNPLNYDPKNPEFKINILTKPNHSSQLSDNLFLGNASPTSSILQLKSKAPQRRFLYPNYLFDVPSSYQPFVQPKFEHMTKAVPLNKIENIPVQQCKQTQILSPSKCIPYKKKIIQSSLPTPLHSIVDYVHNYSPISVTTDQQITPNQINIPLNFIKQNIYPSEGQIKGISSFSPLKSKNATFNNICSSSDISDIAISLPNRSIKDTSNENLTTNLLKSLLQESSKYPPEFNRTTSNNLLSVPSQTSKNLSALLQKGIHPYESPDRNIQNISPTLLRSEASYLPLIAKASPHLSSLNICSTYSAQLPTTYSTPFLTPPCYKYALPDEKIQNISPTPTTLEDADSFLLGDITPPGICDSISSNIYPLPKPRGTIQVPMSYSIPQATQLHKHLPLYENIQNISPTLLRSRNAYTIHVPDKTTSISANIYPGVSHIHTIQEPSSYSNPLYTRPNNKYIPSLQKLQSISPNLQHSEDADAHLVPDKIYHLISPNIYPIPNNIHTTKLPTSHSKPWALQPSNKHIPSDESLQNMAPPLLASGDGYLPVPDKTTYSFSSTIYPDPKFINATDEPTSCTKPLVLEPINKYISPVENSQIISPNLLYSGVVYALPVKDKTSYSLTNMYTSPKLTTAESLSYSKPLAIQSNNKHNPPGEKLQHISNLLDYGDANALPVADKTSYSFLPKMYPYSKLIHAHEKPSRFLHPLAMQTTIEHITPSEKLQNISATLLGSCDIYTHPIPYKTSYSFLPNIYPSPKLIYAPDKPSDYSKLLGIQQSYKYMPPDEKLQNISPMLLNSGDAKGLPLSDNTPYCLSSYIYPSTNFKPTTQVPSSYFKPLPMKSFEVLSNRAKQDIASYPFSSKDVYSLPVNDKSLHSSLPDVSPTLGDYKIQQPLPLNLKPITDTRFHSWLPPFTQLSDSSLTTNINKNSGIISKPLTPTFKSADISPVLNLVTHQNIISKLTPCSTQFYNVNSNPTTTRLTDREIHENFSDFTPSELQYSTPAISSSNQFNTIMPYKSKVISNAMFQKPLLSLIYRPYVRTSNTVFNVMEPRQEIKLQPYLKPLYETESLISTNNINLKNPQTSFIDNFSTISPFISNQMDCISPMIKNSVLWVNSKNSHNFKSPYTIKVFGNSNVPVKSSVIHPLSIPATSEVPVTYLPFTSTDYCNTLLQNILTPPIRKSTIISAGSDSNSIEKLSHISNLQNLIGKLDNKMPFLSQANQTPNSASSSLDIPKDVYTATDNIASSLYQCPYLSKFKFLKYNTPNLGLNKPINNATKKYKAYQSYTDTPMSEITQQSNPDISQINYDLKKLISKPKVLNDLLNKNAISIPLENIGIAKYEPLKFENANCVRTDNPEIDLKVWPATIRVLKPKLILEAVEMKTLNFIPIVKKSEYTYDRVQTIVQDFVSKAYGKPVVIKAVCNYTNANAFAINFNDDYVQNNIVYVVWPTICERGCISNGYRCSFN